MEQRFGYDFSRVRVYSGGNAEQSAMDLNAHAYTIGKNIVFARGHGAKTTERQLLAHELTHVIQQSGVNHSPSGLESEANDAAARVVRGENVTIRTGTVPSLQRAALSDGEIDHLNEEQLRRRLVANEQEGQSLVVSPEEAERLKRENIHLKEALNKIQRGSSQTPAKQDGVAAAQVVSQRFSDVASDTMYLDNFVNDVNDAWLSNDRVFVFEYENGAVLKIGYADILKLLNVPSELNPQSTEAELGKKYKIPPDLELPKSTSPTPFITIGKTAFLRDPETQVIYPSGPPVYEQMLPRISAAVKQVEPARESRELWERAAPKVLEVITNMEWGAPRAFGGLLVRAGKKLRKAGKTVAKAVAPKAAVPPKGGQPPAPKAGATRGGSSASKPPSDPYDTEAWKKYYEQNPGAKRSLGSAQADDPSAFTQDKETNIPPEQPSVSVEPRARGGAIESSHLDSMPEFSRPKEHDFPGIDGWKGGREMTRDTNAGKMRIIYGADVLQIKSVGSSNQAVIRARVSEGIAGLEPNVFEKGVTRVVNPNSRRLDVLFEEGALLDVSAEIKAFLTELAEGAGKSGVGIRWFRFSAGRKFSIPIP